MRRFSPIEIGGMALGIFLALGGLVAVIWPQPGVLPHFANEAFGSNPHYAMEVLSRDGARIYGVLAFLLGSGIAIFSGCRGRP